MLGKHGDGLEYYEEPGEYTDKWGIAHPYTSEDYKTDPQRDDQQQQQQWAPRKGKGGGGGSKKWWSQGGKGNGGGSAWGGRGQQVWQEVGYDTYHGGDWSEGWDSAWW
eukprot:14369484-Alexandrium_andersonii.AAC.2